MPSIIIYKFLEMQPDQCGNQQNRIIIVACRVHYDIVRIHAFEEGSKRLGRLCMYCILQQDSVQAEVHIKH